MAFLHLSLLAAAFCSHFLLSRTNCLAVNFRLNRSDTHSHQGSSTATVDARQRWAEGGRRADVGGEEMK